MSEKWNEEPLSPEEALAMARAAGYETVAEWEAGEFMVVSPATAAAMAEEQETEAEAYHRFQMAIGAGLRAITADMDEYEAGQFLAGWDAAEEESPLWPAGA